MSIENDARTYEAPRIVERTLIALPLIGQVSKPSISAEFRRVPEE
jgi:hypothetical protein